MTDLPEIAGLIVFILAGRLFLKTFKTKPEGWQIRSAIYLALSLSAFGFIAFGFFQAA